MSDSESDDDLRPYQLGRSEFGHDFFLIAMMMMKWGTTPRMMASASPPLATALPTMLTTHGMMIPQRLTANSVKIRLRIKAQILERKSPQQKFFIQCTTWKDKKQVMFLHTNTIGRTKDNHVRRHVRGQRDRNVIRAPLSQATYIKWFNAVNRNDHDSADYSTTIRTNRYYIRLLCWALDRVLHASYVIVCECAKAGIGPNRWKRYLSKHHGRHDFQVELGISLLNRAIELDWNGVQLHYSAYMIPSTP